MLCSFPFTRCSFLISRVNCLTVYKRPLSEEVINTVYYGKNRICNQRVTWLMPLKHYYTGGFIFSGNMPQTGNGGEGEQCVTSHGTGNARLLSCQFAVEETWIIKRVGSVSGESSPWSGIPWTEGKAILSRLIKHKKVPGNYSHSNLWLIINPNSLQALKQYFLC